MGLPAVVAGGGAFTTTASTPANAAGTAPLGYRGPLSFGAGPALRDEWEARHATSAHHTHIFVVQHSTRCTPSGAAPPCSLPATRHIPPCPQLLHTRNAHTRAGSAAARRSERRCGPVHRADAAGRPDAGHDAHLLRLLQPRVPRPSPDRRPAVLLAGAARLQTHTTGCAAVVCCASCYFIAECCYGTRPAATPGIMNTVERWKRVRHPAVITLRDAM